MLFRSTASCRARVCSASGVVASVRRKPHFKSHMSTGCRDGERSLRGNKRPMLCSRPSQGVCGAKVKVMLLRVRKRGQNTAWVARELARLADVRQHDVGYAGLKDRNAVTTQWFSLPARRRTAADFVGSGGEGFEVLEAHAHRRKLPRGALAGNDFRIMLRGVTGEPTAIEARLEVQGGQRPLGNDSGAPSPVPVRLRRAVAQAHDHVGSDEFDLAAHERQAGRPWIHPARLNN